MLVMAAWTVACQAPLCMGAPTQGYWSGLPFPSPEDLPNLGIEPVSSPWQVDSLPNMCTVHQREQIVQYIQ